MATFTHTTTWLVNIDGRSTTYTFSYDIEDVVDISRASRYSHAGEDFSISSGPTMVAVLNKSDIQYLGVDLTESAGPTSAEAAKLYDGDIFVAHLSDIGGVWNESGVNNTATLRDLDSIAVSSNSSVINMELMVLHQAAS